MAHDYLIMTPEQLRDLEREAYASGDTDRAALFAALMDLIDAANKVDELESELDSIKEDTQDHEAYKSFFEDCFARLDKHYPYPEVTSDYDRSVIFDAIEAGEAARIAGEGED